MNPSAADELLQCRFGEPSNIHCLVPNEVDELPQAPGLTIRIITKQCPCNPLAPING